jgi:hypothetical protein
VQKSVRAWALRRARVMRKIGIVGHHLIGFLSSSCNRHRDEANLSASGLYLTKNQHQNRSGGFYRVEHGYELSLGGSLLIPGRRVGSGPGKALMGLRAGPGSRLRTKHKRGFSPQLEWRKENPR